MCSSQQSWVRLQASEREIRRWDPAIPQPECLRLPRLPARPWEYQCWWRQDAPQARVYRDSKAFAMAASHRPTEAAIARTMSWCSRQARSARHSLQSDTALPPEPAAFFCVREQATKKRGLARIPPGVPMIMLPNSGLWEQKVHRWRFVIWPRQTYRHRCAALLRGYLFSGLSTHFSAPSSRLGILYLWLGVNLARPGDRTHLRWQSSQNGKQGGHSPSLDCEAELSYYVPVSCSTGSRR